MVYPHTIVRPMPRYKVDSSKYLRDFIADMTLNNCIIKAFVADNKKRADAREALNHASSFGCEYCFSKASSYIIGEKQILTRKKNTEYQIASIEKRIQNLEDKEEQDEEELEALRTLLTSLKSSLKELNKTKKQLVWPSSTMNGPPRTTEEIKRIVEKIENGEANTKDERKGIVGRSPFLDLDYFDMVRDIPTEYLHSGCIGVVKRLVSLTFNVGITRPRATKRKLSRPELFNLLMSKVKGPREFSRRARNLDFSVLKAQEFRNIILFYFKIVIDCIEEEYVNERRVWLFLAYMLRACVIPQNEFQNVNLADIDTCAKKFYTLYEQLFTQMNCTYNTHIIGAHMIEMRVHGPLTLTSAFGFESFYGEIRNSFVPGTSSTVKQIMQKVLLRRVLSKHQCKPTVHITNHNTELECNNLIYTYTHRTYNLYKVVDVQKEDEILNCVKINTCEMFFEETPNLNWDLVGVFQLESIDNEVKNISEKYVAGKVIQIDDMLITCPLNVLDEK